MPTYTYRARDAAGKIVSGQMEAADARTLRQKLSEGQFFIIEYSEKKARQSLLSREVFTLGPKVSLADLSVLSWQLYTMLNAGLPLVRSLRIIINQSRNPFLSGAVAEACQMIEAGSSFSEAMAHRPDVFPQFFIKMVNAGEVGGVLDDMLKRVALYYERQSQLRMQLRTAMVYPFFLVVMVAAVIAFLLVFVLPRFTAVFAEMGVVIPLTTRLLLEFGGLVRLSWPVIAASLAGLFLFFQQYKRTKLGRMNVDTLRLRLPFLGELVRKTVAARFTQTLSTLIGAGIPILTALDVVVDTLDNVFIIKVLREVATRVGEGKPIAQPLEQSRVFPEMVINMIQVGEETGALDKMLEKVAQFYTLEVDNAITAFTKIIEPVLIVVMTGVIGFIAASIFLPMTSILKGLHT